MRTTKISYACDSCGKAVSRPKELQRYDLGAGRTYKTRQSVSVDLCAECGGKLLSAVAPFVPDELTPVLMELA